MKHLSKWFLLAIISFSLNTFAKTTDKEAPLHIEADQLEMREKENISIYNGNVIITKGSLKITGEKIIIHSKNGALDSIQINGKPATFYQINDLDEAISAESYSMNYIARSGILELREKALLQKNKNNFSSEHIFYDTLEDIVKAGSNKNTPEDKAQRVKITIHPEPDINSNKDIK